VQVCLTVESEEDVGWAQWLSLAHACEQHGLLGLFGSDHYASVEGRREHGSLDLWATLAGLAASTHRIRLGSLVSPVTFRAPSVLAKCAVTVDHISGGRVELGLGAGWFEDEHRAYGLPFPPLRERLQMLAEQLEIIRRQWSEREPSVHGRRYRLERCPARFRPLQRPHPPIILGGDAGPRSVALAARWADEYNVAGKPVDECAASAPGSTRRASARGAIPGRCGCRS
jgi:alkanesulfonate monooxygenase SsuD/methylene tetrahydromethanopterin reductase-like flavin-dependent oxidoreductase (luciferase family)